MNRMNQFQRERIAALLREVAQDVLNDPFMTVDDVVDCLEHVIGQAKSRYIVAETRSSSFIIWDQIENTSADMGVYLDVDPAYAMAEKMNKWEED